MHEILVSSNSLEDLFQTMYHAEKMGPKLKVSSRSSSIQNSSISLSLDWKMRNAARDVPEDRPRLPPKDPKKNKEVYKFCDLEVGLRLETWINLLFFLNDFIPLYKKQKKKHMGCLWVGASSIVASSPPILGVPFFMPYPSSACHVPAASAIGETWQKIPPFPYDFLSQRCWVSPVETYIFQLVSCW